MPLHRHKSRQQTLWGAYDDHGNVIMGQLITQLGIHKATFRCHTKPHASLAAYVKRTTFVQSDISAMTFNS